MSEHSLRHDLQLESEAKERKVTRLKNGQKGEMRIWQRTMKANNECAGCFGLQQKGTSDIYEED